jgi:hypothetical protein
MFKLRCSDVGFDCPGVITVAAVGANSARASFSNFGAVTSMSYVCHESGGRHMFTLGGAAL